VSAVAAKPAQSICKQDVIPAFKVEIDPSDINSGPPFCLTKVDVRAFIPTHSTTYSKGDDNAGP
jgi:hypothetical protein